ncbi:MAG: hypothetical protein WD850_02800 [Candidatus Spechtbacterales bacterium]
MTRIAVSVTNRHLTYPEDEEDLRRLQQRLEVVPTIAFGSPDVQVAVYPVWGEITQSVWAGEGNPVERGVSSSISLEMLHVHNKATQADNDLAARAALAAIWGTLAPSTILNPNVLVLKNGSPSFGWTEDKPAAGYHEVVAVLDAFHQGRPDREQALSSLRTLLAQEA